MKIENFDDAIKKKLENIDSSYNESDIQRVHDYVTRNSTLLHGRNLKRSAILIGSSMIIAALIIWNVILVDQNKELHHTINGLHAELSTINKKQTVLNTSNISHQGSVITANNYIHRETVHYNAAPVALENNVIAIKQRGNNVPEKNSERNTTITADNNTPVTTQVNQAKTVVEAQAIKTDVATTINENITKNINKDTVIPEKKVVENTNTKTSDVVVNNNNSKDEGQQTLPVFHNIHYNAGINLIAGKSQIGGGLSGEALLKDRWGLCVGFNVLGIINEKYNDDADFVNCKHTQFTATYNLHNNDSINRYFHIKINNILYQLPLAINYHLELRHKFSFILGAGTDLDIHVKQQVGYLHKLDTISKNGKLGHKFSPDFFNDIVINAGIQKRWGLFLFQMCPYASYQVRQVIYKKEKLYYGLCFGIKYNFAK